MHCVDVANFVKCGFGVWLLPYSTLEKENTAPLQSPQLGQAHQG